MKHLILTALSSLFCANGWTPSPGHDMARGSGTWPRLESYVKDIITTFRDDRRV